jgi:hypothetical protein
MFERAIPQKSEGIVSCIEKPVDVLFQIFSALQNLSTFFLKYSVHWKTVDVLSQIFSPLENGRRSFLNMFNSRKSPHCVGSFVIDLLSRSWAADVAAERKKTTHQERLRSGRAKFGLQPPRSHQAAARF